MSFKAEHLQKQEEKLRSSTTWTLERPTDVPHNQPLMDLYRSNPFCPSHLFNIILDERSQNTRKEREMETHFSVLCELPEQVSRGEKYYYGKLENVEMMRLLREKKCWIFHDVDL